MVYFPPFIAFVFAGIMNLFHFEFQDVLQNVFQKLGTTITPIAMISVGLQLSIDRKVSIGDF